ncbi:hypothetical protein DXG01_014743 [Tephrocybe rancida]|nr:hypothetical protein DXG01_014743 [Tephrocybe rancida]
MSRAHAHAPYPPRRSMVPETLRPEVEHCYKVQLAYQLNTCQLPRLPTGFPFLSGYIHKTHPESLICHPYEVLEELPIQNQPSAWALIKFNGHAPQDKDRNLTWEVYVSDKASQLRNSRNLKTPVAKVQVNLELARGFYWNSLVYDPTTLLRALAISLELGKAISIELYDKHSVVYVTHGRERKNYLVVKEMR